MTFPKADSAILQLNSANLGQPLPKQRGCVGVFMKLTARAVRD